MTDSDARAALPLIDAVKLSRLRDGVYTWVVTLSDDGTGLPAVVDRLAEIDAKLRELFPVAGAQGATVAHLSDGTA